MLRRIASLAVLVFLLCTMAPAYAQTTPRRSPGVLLERVETRGEVKTSTFYQVDVQGRVGFVSQAMQKQLKLVQTVNAKMIALEEGIIRKYFSAPGNTAPVATPNNIPIPTVTPIFTSTPVPPTSTIPTDLAITPLGLRPKHNQFLASVQIVMPDSATNSLILFDRVTRTLTLLPWLGKSPDWSPDGRYLAGTQLTTTKAGDPRFDVVVYDVDLAQTAVITETQMGSSCNPQWSEEGNWIAYDLVDARFQSYIDCFPGRGVVAQTWPDRENYVVLTSKLPEGVHLVAWIAQKTP